MHVALGPGERLDPRDEAAARALLDDAGVGAVLLPLRPEGDAFLARAARRYMDQWDARFVHPQNYFAPGARVASRAPLPWRNGEAAPMLAAMLARGLRIEALPGARVVAPLARDLESWQAFWRAEGVAWGEAAARHPELRGFLPPSWPAHSLGRAHRRVVEALQALRRPDAPGLLLHLAREAAWAKGCEEGAARVGAGSGAI